MIASRLVMQIFRFSIMRNIVFIILIFGLWSCTEVVELPFPATSSNLVLNCILHPDSIIKARITTSLPATDTNNRFVTVSNATMLLYENNNLLDTFAYGGNGTYELERYPKPGSEYKINVIVPGYPVLTASEQVPLSPSVNVCYDEFLTLLGGNYIDIIVYLSDVAKENNAYWFHVVLSDYKRLGRLKYDSTQTENIPVFYLLSTSAIADDFNAILDHTYGRNGYRYYLRLEDKSFNGSVVEQTIGFTDNYFRFGKVATFTEDQEVIIHITNASQNYDRYLKSSFTYFLNQDFYEPNLFFEPIQIHSNIENGTGIFAAYNSISIPVEEFPCE